MKLRDCVLMGLFCDLETVEECVANYDMHYLQCIPYSEVNEDIAELVKEIKAWQAGTLVLDWDELHAENAKAWKEYEEYCKAEMAKPSTPIEEIDFEF
jgi:hypothetical protein